MMVSTRNAWSKGSIASTPQKTFTIEAAYVKPSFQTFVKRKCSTRCNEGVDRISQLPDEIIMGILSFLSVKEAAATSVLSTRWSDLWRRTPNLKFDTTTNPFHEISKGESSWEVERGKYIEWVNSVVESNKALYLKEFKICFFLNKSSAHCAVPKWLEFVFSRRVEVLELDFHGECNDRRRNVPVLEELLRECSISISSCAFKSSNLKSLCLKSLKVSGETIGLFLRNCPLLERLIIKLAVLTSDLEVCGGGAAGRGLVLKHLDIHHCSGGKSIKVSAPNLTWLRIDDGSERLMLENEINAPKLVASKDTTQHFADHALRCSFSQQIILNFTRHCPQGFLANGFPQMPKLKELIVNYYGHGLPPITSLLWASPCVQKFELKYLRKSSIEQGMEAANVERFRHRHLRVFKFSGFDVGAGDHMELVSYILDNCVALEKIIIRILIQFPHLLIFPDMETLRAKRRADREFVKQLLQPKLPTHIQLLVI